MGSIYLSIHGSMAIHLAVESIYQSDLSIYLSIYLSINLSVSLCICLATNQTIRNYRVSLSMWCYLSINRNLARSGLPSWNQSITAMVVWPTPLINHESRLVWDLFFPIIWNLSINLCIYLSIYQPIQLSSYLSSHQSINWEGTLPIYPHLPMSSCSMRVYLPDQSRLGLIKSLYLSIYLSNNA